MKTILAIFTREKKEDTSKEKMYSFNTTHDVKVGDLLTDPSYSTKLQVVEIKEETFKNVNVETGELTNVGDIQYPIYPIKELQIKEEQGDEDETELNTPE